MSKTSRNPHTGVTEGQLMSRVRSALRKVSVATTRASHIKAVRFHKISRATGRNKWHLRCVLCSLDMPCGERVFKTKNDGSLYKKNSSIYEIDHIHGNPPLKTMSDLSAYAESLFYGEVRVLCWKCHKSVTKGQSAVRRNDSLDFS